MCKDGLMECPICLKEFQRLKLHLTAQNRCASKIDTASFCKSFDIFDMERKKNKERERKAAYRKRQRQNETQKKIKGCKVKM